MKSTLHKLGYYIIKAAAMAIIALFYILEFLFYYMFTSPVDMGYAENSYGDLTFLTAIAAIKLLIIIITVLGLKRLPGSSCFITLSISAASFIEIIALIPALFHITSSLSAARDIIPVCTNILIFLFGAIYYSRVQKVNNTMESYKGRYSLRSIYRVQ